MIDTQRSKDFLMKYDTDTGTLTLDLYIPQEQRSIEIYLLDTAVQAALELLARNVLSVSAHVRGSDGRI